MPSLFGTVHRFDTNLMRTELSIMLRSSVAEMFSVDLPTPELHAFEMLTSFEANVTERTSS